MLPPSRGGIWAGAVLLMMGLIPREGRVSGGAGPGGRAAHGRDRGASAATAAADAAASTVAAADAANSGAPGASSAEAPQPAAAVVVDVRFSSALIRFSSSSWRPSSRRRGSGNADDNADIEEDPPTPLPSPPFEAWADDPEGRRAAHADEAAALAASSGMVSGAWPLYVPPGDKGRGRSRESPVWNLANAGW